MIILNCFVVRDSIRSSKEVEKYKKYRNAVRVRLHQYRRGVVCLSRVLAMRSSSEFEPPCHGT